MYAAIAIEKQKVVNRHQLIKSSKQGPTTDAVLYTSFPKKQPHSLHCIVTDQSIMFVSKLPSLTSVQCMPHPHQNFSIKFFLTVHILPLLPQIYTGMVVSKQAN